MEITKETVINEGKQVNMLSYMLDYKYYCSWDTLKENIRSNGDSVSDFLDSINKCKTVGDINNIVSNYI